MQKKRRVRNGKLVKLSRGSRLIKKPLLLANVEAKRHSMHRNSGIVLYWLVLLALVVLNLLSVLVIPVMQLALQGNRMLLVVAAFGFFFGYVTNKLLSLVDNLEAKHHFMARLLVPVAALANLFLMSMAANRFVDVFGVGFAQNPLLITAAYGIAFILPSLGFLATMKPAGLLPTVFPAKRPKKAKP